MTYRQTLGIVIRVQYAQDGEKKNHEIKMRNKVKGQSISDNRGNDLEVGKNLMFSAKVGLEHLTARMNTAENRFGKDGKSQTMKSLKCNDRQFELYLVGSGEPLEIRAAELNFRKITLAGMRKMNGKDGRGNAGRSHRRLFQWQEMMKV